MAVFNKDGYVDAEGSSLSFRLYGGVFNGDLIQSSMWAVGYWNIDKNQSVNLDAILATRTQGSSSTSEIILYPLDGKTYRIEELNLGSDWKISSKNINPCITAKKGTVLPYSGAQEYEVDLFDLCLIKSTPLKILDASNAVAIRIYISTDDLNKYGKDNPFVDFNYLADGTPCNYSSLNLHNNFTVQTVAPTFLLDAKINDPVDDFHSIDFIIRNNEPTAWEIKDLIISPTPFSFTKPPEISPSNTNRTLTLTDTGFNFTLSPNS